MPLELTPERARNRFAAMLTAPAGMVVTGFLSGVVLLLLLLSLQQERATSLNGAAGLQTWALVLSDPFTLSLWQRSLRIAAVTAVLAVLLGWPLAWALTRVTGAVRIAGFCLIAAPMLFSVVVRSYGWVLLLLPGGWLAQLLPVKVLYTEAAVVLVLLHAVLPFAVLPIYGALRAIPPALTEAARDLGASGPGLLAGVIAPLSLPGVLSALQIVFTLSVSSYVIPRFMGGGRTPVLASDIYGNLEAVRWPVAAIEALLLILSTVVVVGLLSALGQRLDWRRSSRSAL